MQSLRMHFYSYKESQALAANPALLLSDWSVFSWKRSATNRGPIS